MYRTFTLNSPIKVILDTFTSRFPGHKSWGWYWPSDCFPVIAYNKVFSLLSLLLSRWLDTFNGIDCFFLLGSLECLETRKKSTQPVEKNKLYSNRVGLTKFFICLQQFNWPPNHWWKQDQKLSNFEKNFFWIIYHIKLLSKMIYWLLSNNGISQSCYSELKTFSFSF